VFEDEHTTVKSQEINNEEITLNISSKADEPSLFADGISLNEIQSDAIVLFCSEIFSVPFL